MVSLQLWGDIISEHLHTTGPDLTPAPVPGDTLI